MAVWDPVQPHHIRQAVADSPARTQVAGEELDPAGCVAAAPGEHAYVATGVWQPPDD
jgi:hypothetical protein